MLLRRATGIGLNRYGPTRSKPFVVLRVLIGGSVLLAFFALFINLSWFDEPLHPKLASLKEPHFVSLEGNAYASALGFLAAEGVSSQIAGQQVIGELREKYRQGRNLTLSGQELAVIMGGSNLDEGWQRTFKSLACNARRYFNCAEQLIADVAQEDSIDSRLNTLLERYSSILEQPRFEENQERDVSSPMPSYRLMMAVARLRLAMSYRNDHTPEFLDKAAGDFEFWLRVLRESETLPTKMVSLAGMQNNLDFISTLLRHRELEEVEHQKLRAFLRPLTREESDIGEAFVAESRIALLSESPPAVMNSSFVTRLLLQEHATLNEAYMTGVIPMLERASLTAADYYHQKANTPLIYQIRIFPPPLYNLGGKLALSKAPDPAEFPARVHDQNGRILLVLLQTEIERSPETISRKDVIDGSRYRNPYTDEAMEFDQNARTIGFKCMHTIFHPPDPPDVCAFPLDSGSTNSSSTASR
jgi:hypothetical protein